MKSWEKGGWKSCPLGDGDLVFAHVRYPGRIPVAGVDIFRVDGAGRMAEHRDVLQMESETLPGETTLF